MFDQKPFKVHLISHVVDQLPYSTKATIVEAATLSTPMQLHEIVAEGNNFDADYVVPHERRVCTLVVDQLVDQGRICAMGGARNAMRLLSASLIGRSICNGRTTVRPSLADAAMDPRRAHESHAH